ncbi:MAG: hypothetical protein LAO24_09755 [Acidobacteriia bacterium]|nr:hypothetical protein [Terriglobia bacterium]
MLTLVIERTRNFDRQIAVRNAIECCAAVFVTLLFSWFAWRAPGLLEGTGMAIVAASGVWIAFYILRFGSGPKPLDPGVSLNAYRQLLRDGYDQQIRLLRNVKYWYLLPPYIGLVIANLGFWLRLKASGTPAWGAIAAIGVVTGIFALVWIANEFFGVRHLERLKRDLATTEAKES